MIAGKIWLLNRVLRIALLPIATGSAIWLTVTYWKATTRLTDEWPWFEGMIIAIGIALMSACFPDWVKLVLSAQAPSGRRSSAAPLAGYFQRLSRLKISDPRIAILDCEHAPANALHIGGIGPRSWILVSRKAMDQLTDDELTALLWHEQAHADRGHQWIRLAVASGILSIFYAIFIHVQVLPTISPTRWLGFTCMLIGLAYVAGAQWKHCSHLLEYDADLAAVAKAKHHLPLQGNEALCQAIFVLSENDIASSSIGHPSAIQRIAEINRVYSADNLRERHQRLHFQLLLHLIAIGLFQALLLAIPSLPW